MTKQINMKPIEDLTEMNDFSQYATWLDEIMFDSVMYSAESGQQFNERAATRLYFMRELRNSLLKADNCTLCL